LDRALANIGSVLREAEMAFEDVVQLNFYVTSRDDYAAARREFGKVWRRHCGKHYPGMAMFQVVSLFDPEARIEVQGIAAR
jgi:enamine deaminase RidA (YjgF/YER057c/UK114 family)